MAMPKRRFEQIISALKRDFERIHVAQEMPLSEAKPSKGKPGVYMLFFEGNLQYVGSSKNLYKRIRSNLLSGDEKSHTLINKLCKLRENWDKYKARKFLKSSAKIKFIKTDSVENAKILEGVLIAVYKPYYNKSLKQLLKEKQ